MFSIKEIEKVLNDNLLYFRVNLISFYNEDMVWINLAKKQRMLDRFDSYSFFKPVLKEGSEEKQINYWVDVAVDTENNIMSPKQPVQFTGRNVAEEYTEGLAKQQRLQNTIDERGSSNNFAKVM